MSARWKVRIGFVAACLLAAGPSGTVVAADTSADASTDTGLVEIVVTAQRRAQRLKDVPISVTAISPEMAQKLDILDVEHVQLVTPGLSYSSGISYAQAYIRGIGSSFTNPGMEPAVATYIDGAYLSRGFGSLFNIVDPASIQVLKGPQGTLWGRNATGGALLLNTADPENKFSGHVTAEGGNFDHRLFEGVLNAPLSDTVAVRFAARYDKDGGFIRNLVDGTLFGGRESETARAKLALRPTEDFEMVFEYQHDEDKHSQGGDAATVGAPYCLLCGASKYTLPLTNSYDTVGNTIGNGVGGRDVSDFINLRVNDHVENYTISSTTGYRNTRSVEAGDFDFTEVPVFNLIQYSGAETLTQNFQVSSNFKGRANFIAGVDYVDDRSYFDLGDFPGSQMPPRPLPKANLIGSNIVNTKSTSVYAEGTLELVTDLKLTAGGRYTDDSRELYNIAQNSWKAFTPRVVVAYDLGQTNVYASYNKGFKSGGFNTPAAAPPANSVDPEKINSYEVGVKFASTDRRMHANLAAFQYDYKDIQVTVIDQLHGGSVLQNAASATGRGAELDFDYLPVQALQLFGGFSFLHARYDSYKNAQIQTITRDPAGSPTGITVGFTDLSGTPLVRAPNFTGFVGATLSSDLGSNWRGELTAFVRHSDSFFFTPGAGGDLHSDVQRSYTTVDMSGKIMPANGHYEVGFFAKNLTNQVYDTFRFTTAPFGAMHDVAPPRTWGLNVRYNF